MSERTGEEPSLGGKAAAVFKADVAVVVGYAIVGIPFGMLGASLGFNPLQTFLLSFFFFSGAGQAMMQNMFLAGFPTPTIVASVTLVSSRHVLYSSAMARYLAGCSPARKFLFAWNLTDEGFGVNLERFESGEPWSVGQAIAVNTVNQFAWAGATTLGAVAMNFVSVPSAIASFGMTCIFLSMLGSQRRTPDVLMAAVAACAGVFAAKALSLDSMAVILGALAGVLAGFVSGSALESHRGRRLEAAVVRRAGSGAAEGTQGAGERPAEGSEVDRDVVE